MKQELEKLKAMIEQHRKMEIEAVNRALSVTSGALVIPRTTERKKRRDEVMEEIIKESAGRDITTNYVVIKYRDRTGKWSVDLGRIASQVFNKLKQRTPPEIVVVREGKGSKSGVYRYQLPEQ